MRPSYLVTTALILLAAMLAPRPAVAQISYNLVVEAGKHDRRNSAVSVNLSESLVQANDRPVRLERAASAVVVDGDGKRWPDQIAKPGLLNEAADPSGQVVRELHFVLPQLKKGEKLELTAVLSEASESDGYVWKDTAGEYADLLDGDRAVLRYVYKAFDDSSPAAREETCKVYHHVYDFGGDRFLTKGTGGLYTHHRGLFYGFSRISYEGADRVNTWGCGTAHQSHAGTLSTETGPVLGRHCVAVDWHGKDAEAFAKEQRELAVHDVPGGHLIEFASRLESAVGPVKLDGDPQHAGFHFRAAQEVADGDQQLTYYLRPGGKGKPGETRNWPGDKDFVNLPWNAMSFVIDGDRYTAVYLDKPTNPKEARYSERSYGRFGSYFEYELDEGKPLEINYRIWLQKGEMEVEQAQALSADFVEPPHVSVSK